MSNTTNKIIKSNKKYLFKYWYLLVVLVVLVVFPKRAAAAELSLGISPSVIRIQISAPAIINEPITIENHGKETVTLKILFKPFTANGENGEVQYLSDNNPLIFEKIYLSENNEVIEKVIIAPKQNKTLNLNMDIPKSEPLSDYYFSVIFISENISEATLNQSKISGGIATNVLLSIKNEERSIGKIVEFSSPPFLEKGHVPFTIRLKNESKHFITPHGEILIKNIFGKIIGQVKLPPINILANTTRLEKATLNDEFLFGVYKATLSISLSDHSPKIIKNVIFWVLPLKFVIGLIILVLIIVFIQKRLKSRRRFFL